MTPPQDFDPKLASTEELDTYGYPPGQEGTFQAASHSKTSCTASTAGAMGAPTACYSPSYAGAMGTGGPGMFKKANMGWYQTAYRAPDGGSLACPNDDYFTWTGFGGFGGRLMQAGTVSSPDAPETNYSRSAMFWEVIGPGVLSPPSFVFTSGDQPAIVLGSHDTRAYISYDEAGHSGSPPRSFDSGLSARPCGYGRIFADIDGQQKCL